MRTTIISVLASILITVPVILQSCCGGIGSGKTYYDIDDMTMDAGFYTGPPQPAPATLDNVNFTVKFKVTYMSMESSGGSMLYACSPAPAIGNQKITAITITSNTDLVATSGTTAAGESLNFRFFVNGVGHIDDPVSDLIGNPLVDDYLVFGSDFVLATAQSHIFTFKITLDDGRTFTLVTDEFEFEAG